MISWSKQSENDFEKSIQTGHKRERRLRLANKTYNFKTEIIFRFSFDLKGRTALHIACEYDNISVVEDLIEANALANVRSKDGSTPLHVKLSSIIVLIW